MSAVRRASWFGVGLLTWLALGCSSDDAGGSSPAGPGGTPSGDPGQRTESASYYVPVPDALEPFATYPVEGVRFEREGTDVEIRYRFPRWLNGKGDGIVLEGTMAAHTTEFAVLVKDMGSGMCERQANRFECYEHLPNLDVDREKAEREMSDAGLGRDEIEQRLRVTDLFQADPIGILEFDLGETAE